LNYLNNSNQIILDRVLYSLKFIDDINGLLQVFKYAKEKNLVQSEDNIVKKLLQNTDF
jgi:hypothetical protein